MKTEPDFLKNEMKKQAGWIPKLPSVVLRRTDSKPRGSACIHALLLRFGRVNRSKNPSEFGRTEALLVWPHKARRRDLHTPCAYRHTSDRNRTRVQR